MIHHRLNFFLVLILLAAVYGADDRVSAATSAVPGQYYLALGDSYAVGVTAAGVPTDPQCTNPNAVGYVCIFYRYLRQTSPHLLERNFAVSGADSCEFLYGYHVAGSSCTRVLDGPAMSQVDEAVAFVKAHPGGVNPITISVGGNDFLPLLPEAAAHPFQTAAKLPQVFATLRANMTESLVRLRTAAGPSARILVVNQLNPIGGLTSPPLPVGLPHIGQIAINGLNAVLKEAAAKVGATYVDDATAFDAHPSGAAALTYVPVTLATGDPSRINIHPTPEGYKLLAKAVIGAYREAGPLVIKVHPLPRYVATGSKLIIRGATSASVRVLLRVTLPGRKTRSVSLTATDAGTFSRRVKAGIHPGRATVRACASDFRGQRACSAKFTFTVR